MPIYPQITEDDVVKAFRAHFSGEPDFCVRAPGRVNLIGEHTDYNGGYVFPMTIDRAVWMAARRRDDGEMRIYSVEYDKECVSDLRKPPVKNQDTWFEYIKGCAWVLLEEGHQLTGLDAVLMGDIPQGAGLSSSAALEVASLLMFSELGGYELPKQKLALLGQRAESQWVGVKCGLMDQTISVLGQKDKALLLDCRNMEHHAYHLPAGTAIAVLDTAARSSPAASAYNERREQCEEACRILGVPLLRDATQAMLDAQRGNMSDVVFRRARHVISENLRAATSTFALLYNDADLFGKLMNASHLSLRYDFEVSCAELDSMAGIAMEHEACLGARMTGGGFGGNAVALLFAAAAADFTAHVSKRYLEETGKVPNVMICRATDGAQVMKQWKKTT